MGAQLRHYQQLTMLITYEVVNMSDRLIETEIEAKSLINKVGNVAHFYLQRKEGIIWVILQIGKTQRGLI